MKKKIKISCLSFSFLIMGIFFTGLNNVSAAQGYFQSEQFVDFNGVLEVGTSYAMGAGEYHTFLLKVIFTGGYSVGSATRSIKMAPLCFVWVTLLNGW